MIVPNSCHVLAPSSKGPTLAVGRVCASQERKRDQAARYRNPTSVSVTLISVNAAGYQQERPSAPLGALCSSLRAL